MSRPLLACTAILLVLSQLPCAAAAAEPKPLALCIDEQPHPPYILANAQGMAPLLIRMAAVQAGLAVEFHTAPLLRCLEQVKLGVSHGYPAGSVMAAQSLGFVVPRLAGKPDPARATLTARMTIFRRKGETIGWDGRGFQNLRQPVLIPTGSVMMRERLGRLNVAVDDQAKLVEQNFLKLLAGRGDLVIGFENDGMALLEQARFADKIEALPLPFTEEHYYLMVSEAYYLANREQIEALWSAIARVRNSPAYRAAANPA